MLNDRITRLRYIGSHLLYTSVLVFWLNVIFVTFNFDNEHWMMLVLQAFLFVAQVLVIGFIRRIDKVKEELIRVKENRRPLRPPPPPTPPSSSSRIIVKEIP